MKQIANPIYDVVFKYLMEDVKIAQLFLSTLLQRVVSDVKVRPNEYTNEASDKVSASRIDFSAQVREKDGSWRLILIELQRRWVETEIIRFRNYIGTQYKNPDNILRADDNKKRYGIPIVTIYLLGNCLDEIREPVLYVRHKNYNHLNQEAGDGATDPFIESLVHDCIIVQIPLLKKRREGRLFEVLSIFDQSRKDTQDGQVLNLEDGAYKGDKEMQLIVRRLLSAASDTEIRHKMDVESEIYMALDSRDATIEEQGKTIAEQGETIARQDETIAKQDETIVELGGQLAEKDKALEEKDKALLSYAKLLLKQNYTIEQVAAETFLPVSVIERIQ